MILATGLRVVDELPRVQEELGGESYIKNLRMENNFSTMTIEASPEDAQKIVYLLSTNPGSVFFTLRHPSDNDTLVLRQTDVADLLGGGVVRGPTNKRPKLDR